MNSTDGSLGDCDRCGEPAKIAIHDVPDSDDRICNDCLLSGGYTGDGDE